MPQLWHPGPLPPPPAAVSGAETTLGIYRADDYGVRPFNVGQRDSSGPLSGLLAFVSAAGGGVVTLDSGQLYQVRHTVTIPSNVELVIPAGSTIQAGPGLSGDILATASGASRVRITGGGTVDGNSSSGGQIAGNGLTLNSATDSRISGPTFANAYADGLALVGCSRVLVDCRVHANGRHGAYHSGSTFCGGALVARDNGQRTVGSGLVYDAASTDNSYTLLATDTRGTGGGGGITTPTDSGTRQAVKIIGQASGGLNNTGMPATDRPVTFAGWVCMDGDGSQGNVLQWWDVSNVNGAKQLGLWSDYRTRGDGLHVYGFEAAYVNNDPANRVDVSLFSADYTGQNLPYGVWHHLAFVRHANGRVVVVFDGVPYPDANGIDQPPTATGGTFTTAPTTLVPGYLVMGGGVNGAHLNGRLACWRVWTADLSAAELIAEANSPTPVRTANLWANYPLNGDRNDASGNGHNFTDILDGNGNTDGVAWGAGPTFGGGGGAAAKTQQYGMLELPGSGCDRNTLGATALVGNAAGTLSLVGASSGTPLAAGSVGPATLAAGAVAAQLAGAVGDAAIAAGGLSEASLGASIARANQLINGGLEIWQRGTGPFTANAGYGPDRWQLSIGAGSTLSVSRATGNNSAYSAAFTYTHSTASQIIQKAEDLPELKGRMLTFAVDVLANVANAVRVLVWDGVSALPYSAYHPGGGVWRRLSSTLAIAPTATFVQAYVELDATVTGNMDNAVLSIGSVAPNYVPLPPPEDLARCLRYYEIIGGLAAGVPQLYGYQAAGQQASTTIGLHARKAVTPSFTKTGTWAVSNCGQPGVTGDNDACVLYVVANAAGAFACYSGAAGQNITAEANP